MKLSAEGVGGAAGGGAASAPAAAAPHHQAVQAPAAPAPAPAPAAPVVGGDDLVGIGLSISPDMTVNLSRSSTPFQSQVTHFSGFSCHSRRCCMG